MMEAVRTSEMSVYSKITRRYIQEGCNLCTCHHKNLKPYRSVDIFKTNKSSRKFAVFHHVFSCLDELNSVISLLLKW
jgi:hypothetical protein